MIIELFFLDLKKFFNYCSPLVRPLVQDLTNIDVSGQLREIKDNFNVDFACHPLKMRCSVCNGDLKEKSKLDILNRIPEGTAKEYDDFWECSKCFKIYWVGSHWEDIKKTISEL